MGPGLSWLRDILKKVPINVNDSILTLGVCVWEPICSSWDSVISFVFIFLHRGFLYNLSKNVTILKRSIVRHLNFFSLIKFSIP